MLFKSMIIALLGLTLTGCAVYGGSGYGHRGYDRHYSTTYYHVPRQPVYVVPRHYRHDGYRYDARRHDHDGRRHDGRRYDHDRHDQRRYLPAPAPRHHQSNGHKYRGIERQAGWSEQRGERRQRDVRGCAAASLFQSSWAKSSSEQWNFTRLNPLSLHSNSWIFFCKSARSLAVYSIAADMPIFC